MKHETISVVHQNTAQWHGQQAEYFWNKYQSYLDDDGLMHPNYIRQVRYALSHYRYHTQMHDFLMRRSRPLRRKYRGYRPDTKMFADDFELALIQRGHSAKKGNQRYMQ